MRAIFVILLFWSISAAYADAPIDAKVITVMDGDTVLVLYNGLKIKIRLANIDAPEKDQAYGMQSKDFLERLLLKKRVRVVPQAMDQYGRTVGLVYLDGRSVNEEQVRRGNAWEYSHFHSDHTYIALQSEAQQARRGLWAERSPLPPWQWRKLHPSMGPSRGHLPKAQPKSSAATVIYDAECGHKKHCSEMSSCEEAFFYLNRCDVKSLDGNHDGVPCESVCQAGK